MYIYVFIAEMFVSVMRTQGSLRLILNTKVWPGMTVMRASQKSVRLTATDGDEGVKVFLLMVGTRSFTEAHKIGAHTK